MRKLGFLFVGYSKVEQTQLCDCLNALGFQFTHLSISSVPEAQLFLSVNTVDFIICHPKILEFMSFIDLLRINLPLLIINPSFIDTLSYGRGHNADDIQNKFPNENEVIIRCGNMTIRPASRSVTVCDQQIALTPTEYSILLLLASSPARVFTYEMITEIVWRENYSFYSRKVISNHVSNIKKKIRAITNAHHYIVSVHGIGYKFIPEQAVPTKLG